MLMRIATWSFSAVLAFSLLGSAEAAPSKRKTPAEAATKDQPDPWRSDIKAAPTSQHRRSPIKSGAPTTPMTTKVLDQGVIEGVDDSSLLYSVPVQSELRAKIAEQRKVPLSQIPERITKRALIDFRTVTLSMIKNREGQQVQLELQQDPLGFVYVTGILADRK